MRLKFVYSCRPPKGGILSRRVSSKTFFLIALTAASLLTTACKEQKSGDDLADAKAGDANAQFKVAFKINDLNGRDVSDKEKKTAFDWYRKAADQGHTEAEFLTGICYNYHQGVDWVEGDQVLAEKYLRKAAEKNHSMAQLKLAELVTTNDPTQAFNWLSKAAAQNNPRAIYNLSRMYINGDGVEKDDMKSVLWLRKGVEIGSAECLYDLGLCYEYGRGTPKDEIEAYACYNVAAVSIEQARKNLESIEKNMPTEVRLRAQQRSKELQKEIEAKIAAKQASK
jgi:TPR repeat protein